MGKDIGVAELIFRIFYIIYGFSMFFSSIITTLLFIFHVTPDDETIKLIIVTSLQAIMFVLVLHLWEEKEDVDVL